MAASTTAKRVQLFVAVFVGTALLLRLGLTIFDPDPAPDDPNLLTRMTRFVSYFTIQSNLVVVLAALAVVKGKPVDDPWWRALRLASLVGITVTGIVYMTILAGDIKNEGLAQVASYMLHYIAPPLTVIAWIAAGPWPAMTLSDVPRTLIWPLLWIVYTLVRGAIADWYPYPFIDVIAKGYGKVAINILAITVFAIVLSLAYVALSRARRRGSETPESPRSEHR
ncbi:MAG: Pr6Pr family membrane protein [Solirubrobacterales bacterium]|nr:Pr6Pr family membrane protein [Solirubrobacterales bacterium]